jgi:DNA phosphorothioation-associated putative methyltransferase
MDSHENFKAQASASRNATLSAQAPETIRRGRTAIRRYRCSRPIAIALADGLINRTTTVFDYGCGHDAEVRYLRAKGVRASGWDPHHQPRAKIQPADVVNLGYVLNVIEDPSERAQTLHKAVELTKKTLIVAVRADSSLEDAERFGDGKITVAGTWRCPEGC